MIFLINHDSRARSRREVVIKFTQMLFEFLVNDQKNDGPRLLWKSCGHRLESLEAKVDSGKCEDKHMNDLPSGYD